VGGAGSLWPLRWHVRNSVVVHPQLSHIGFPMDGWCTSHNPLACQVAPSNLQNDKLNLKGGNMIVMRENCDDADREKKSKSKHTDTHQKIDMWHIRD